MVRYDYILKAIDNELSKSHQRLSVHLSFPQVESTFDSFHNDTCNEKRLKRENGILTNNKGERLLFFRRGKWRDYLDGTEHSVSEWDWYDILNHHQDEGDLHFTHNHPRGDKDIVAECLSSNDVQCLLYGREVTDPNTGKNYIDFPLKSMSCESSNGSRMTLTRGDKFKLENHDKAIRLSKELEECWSDYLMKYRAKKIQIIEKVPKGKFNNKEDLNQYVMKQAVKELGTFEKTTVFKDIQKDFRKIDCQLEMSYPKDYTVNY